MTRARSLRTRVLGVLGLLLATGAVTIGVVASWQSAGDRGVTVGLAVAPAWIPSSGPEEIPAWFASSGISRAISGHVHGDRRAVVHVRLDVPDPRVWRGLDLRVKASGEFDAGTLPAGRYQIVATAPGLTSRVWTIDTANQGAPDLDIHLNPCAVASGALVASEERMRPRGSPVAGATIELAGLIVGKSDAGGRFSACVPIDGWELTFRAPGFGVSQRWGPAPPDVISDGVLAMPPAARIQGRVTDPDGSPIVGVVVHPIANVCLSCDPWARVMAITDADGRFVIEDIAESDRYLLRLVEGGTSHTVHIGETGDVVLELPPREQRNGYRAKP